MELSVIVVDNASDLPLSSIPSPDGLRVAHVRLDENRGGSGGFNAGLEAALERLGEDDEDGLLWLLDSDAVPEPGALRGLIEAMERHPQAAVVGSMLCDPVSGEGYELGGRVDRRTGEYVPVAPGPVHEEGVFAVEYVAACSMLVRAHAARRAGLMSELFINGDDVEWCARLRRCASSARGDSRGAAPVVLASAASRVAHPPPDKMRTWQRYYAARNAMTVLSRVGAGRRAILTRALRETARGATQCLVGRDDLARLHVSGLADAAKGEVTGKAPAERVAVEPFREWTALARTLTKTATRRVQLGSGLEPALRARVVAACEEAGVGIRFGAGFRDGETQRLAAGVVAVSARARRADWLAGRTIVTCAPEGFSVRRISLIGRGLATGRVLIEGSLLAARLAFAGVRAAPAIGRAERRDREAAPKTGVVVLSYNRKRAVMEKLSAIDDDPAFETGCVLVVDNGSTDGTREAVRRGAKGVSLLSMDENVGVAAFNRGVEAIDSEYVLILDDDAHPAEGALERAVGILDARPEIAAVTLHPKHPETLESEWSFAHRGPSDAWPVMGCGNLVRRADWMAAQGYEEGFFLYRNDTDLALKLLSMGRGVHFDPELIVWHDSRAIRRKSRHWFRGATRNWVWMCRRHGRGWAKGTGILAGYAWAHRLAGMDPLRHIAALRGFAAGVLTPPPPTPEACDRGALVHLLRLRFGRGPAGRRQGP